ncbi:MAG: hypothetical protein ACFCU8_08305 [Thermosynechococcaceae cyanobacterium]
MIYDDLNVGINSLARFPDACALTSKAGGVATGSNAEVRRVTTKNQEESLHFLTSLSHLLSLNSTGILKLCQFGLAIRFSHPIDFWYSL